MKNALAALDLLRWAATRNATARTRARSLVSDAATMLFLHSREIDSLAYIASGEPGGWQAACDALFRIQQAALREILEAFQRGDIRALTFKGCELVSRHFAGHSLGLIADLDILIPREQVEDARRVMYGAGFCHGVFDAQAGLLRNRDIADVAGMELNHYELAPFMRVVEMEPTPASIELAQADDSHPLYLVEGKPVAVIEVDLHHNVALDADAEMLFRRAVPGSLGLCETLSPADHIWLNLSRYYNEVSIHDKISLRPIAYTLPEIANGQVDWTVMASVAAELKLGPTLYYFLSLCDQIVPGVIPEALLAQVHPQRNSRIRDWGWQLGKLLDFVEPFPFAVPLYGEQGATQRVDKSIAR